MQFLDVWYLYALPAYLFPLYVPQFLPFTPIAWSVYPLGLFDPVILSLVGHGEFNENMDYGNDLFSNNPISCFINPMHTIS